MNLFAILCISVNPLVVDTVSVLDVPPSDELSPESIQVSAIPVVNVPIKVFHEEHRKPLSRTAEL